MYGETNSGDATLAPTGDWEAYASVARGSLTPPRLLAVDTGAARAVPLLTTVDLRLPVDLVQRRATEYANFARASGAQHSLRLWRTGYEQAIEALARETTHLDASATCEALFWEERNGEIWVSATFSPPVRRTVH
jgi:hypothetical protein